MSIVISEQIQKEIEQLPEEAQNLLIDFLEILKKRYSKTVNHLKSSEQEMSFLEDAGEFVGALEGGPGDLGTNKTYLEDLGKK